ncbi:MAG TPA: hypothetical protein VL992_08220, partial [Tepidisphaeraceae bacterium]|nr:hypothetical protein [Tepidisphaeraceae bacterium]
MASWSAARADTFGNLFNSDGNQTNLNSSTAWIDETVGGSDSPPPGSNDIAQFDSFTGLSSPTTFTLGGSVSWEGVSVLNPGAAVTIDDVGNESNDVLTLGTAGIAVVSQNLTINDYISLNTSETFTVNSGQNLTVNGQISGSGNTLTFAGGGVTVMTNSNSYTSATALTGGATVSLNFAAAGAPASNIINSGSTLQLSGGNLTIDNGSSANSPSQTFAGTQLGTSGYNVISVSNSGAGSPTLALGTITVPNNKGGVVEFEGLNTINASGAVNAVGTITATASTEGGIIGIGQNGPSGDYATVGLYDWAAILNSSGGTATAASTNGMIVGGSFISNFYTIDTSGKATPNANVDVQGSLTQSSTTSTYTMRFNTATADSVTVSSGAALGLGGILLTPNVGANNIVFNGAGFIDANRGSSGSGSSRETTIWQNDTLGELQISVQIQNGREGGSALALAGPGTTVLSSTTNNYTGSTLIYNGVLLINSNGVLG